MRRKSTFNKPHNTPDVVPPIAIIAHTHAQLEFPNDNQHIIGLVRPSPKPLPI